MKTVYHPNGLSIAGKAWEIRAWFKQQLAKANDPKAPLLTALCAADRLQKSGQVVPFPVTISS